MKQRTTVWACVLVFAGTLASSIPLAHGARSGGSHAGGSHAGAGSAGRSAGASSAHSGHRGSVHHHRAHSSIFISGVFLGPGFYSPPFPPYYAYPSTAVAGPPPTYIEQTPYEPSGYWYYCPDAQNYYPYVQQCPGGWQAVAPQPPYG
jgi:hypothetical protein